MFVCFCFTRLMDANTIVSIDLSRTTYIALGTLLENEYALRSYGINTEDIPLTHTATVKTTNHQRWMRFRSAVEKYKKNQGIPFTNSDTFGGLPLLDSNADNPTLENSVDCPLVSDVVFIQGRLKAVKHWANTDFTNLVRSKVGIYCESRTTNKEKTQIIASIIRDVHENWNGRFLLWVEPKDERPAYGYWVVLHPNSHQLHVKVRTSILTQKSKMSQTQQMTNSVTTKFYGLTVDSKKKRQRDDPGGDKQ